MYDERGQISPMVPAQYPPQGGGQYLAPAQPYYGYQQAPHQPNANPAQHPGQQVGVNNDNQLVKFAMPLITLITQIRHTIDHPNVPALRAQIVEEVKNFERKLTNINYPVRIIVAARYCLCTAVDEAVLGRDWGTNSAWVQGSLLSVFHKETWGGERFYVILEDMLRDIRRNIDFIELIYFLLSLGFEGKFFGGQNRAAREEIRNRIFYHIRHARTKPERNLSPRWKNIKMPRSSSEKKTKLKRVGIYTGITLLILASIFNYMVYHKADPVLNRLNSLAQVSPITVFSQVIERPIVMRNND
ncbi:MAG: type IVB secretion system protein IcmH/DotU [Gammaproteobacteria bacterium]|nr:type IVB secretion system protein IcmH/DotU [Gammaproteobacteria bacterium]